MKRTYSVLLLLVLLTSVIAAMGIQGEIDFDIGEFHSIQLNIPCTMTIVRGNDFMMDIEDRKNHIRELDIHNDKGTLVFRQKEINILKRIKKDELHFVITMPEWRDLRVSSSADIDSSDFWENPEIMISTSASGSITLNDIKADTAEIRITASGDVSMGNLALKGPADLLSSASGDIVADSISCASIQIKNTASGRIKLGDVDSRDGLFELKSSGSGDNTFETVMARNIKLIGKGSGEISGEFISDSLELKLTGSGDAELSGRCGIASLGTNSSGSIDTGEMYIGEATISGSGSGDIILRSGTDIREVSFSGSGKLITR